MTTTRTDQAFQESVQAMADWITFLEQKKLAYERQLERARAAGTEPPAAEIPAVAIDAVSPISVVEMEDGLDYAWQVLATDSFDAEMDAWDLVDEPESMGAGEKGSEMDGEGENPALSLPWQETMTQQNDAAAEVQGSVGVGEMKDEDSDDGADLWL